MATVTGQTGVVKLQLAGQAEAVVGEVKSFTIDTGNNILECSKEVLKVIESGSALKRMKS